MIKHVAHMLLAIVVVSPASGGDILLVTDAGLFIVPVVDGVPQPSQALEEWWPGDIVDQRGELPPPPAPDDIAKQVDQWADAEDQQYRPLFISMYRSILIDVGTGAITLEDVRVSAVKERQAKIWQQVPSPKWRQFSQHIEDMVRGMNQRGEWIWNGVETLQSILKGLSQ